MALLVLVAVCPSMARQQAAPPAQKYGIPARETSRTTQPGQQKQTDPPESVSDTKRNQSPADADNQANKQPTATNKPARQWVDTLTAISTAVIAVFTILTAVIFYLQTRSIHNAERAYLAVIRDTYPDIFGWHSFPLKFGPGSYVFTLKNHGRTPARISSAKARFHLIKKISDLPRIPTYDDERSMVSHEIPQDGTIIVPGGEFQIGAFFEGTAEKPGMQAIDVAAWRNGEITIVGYGYVKYQDAFKRKHETRFCYKVSSHIETVLTQKQIHTYSQVAGPRRYNKAS